MSMIHPMAVVSAKARIGNSVKIGAFAVIEDDVEVGDGADIRTHSILCNGSRIGADAAIYPNAVIGAEPQDLKYKGEPTLAIIGERTVIRECATVNRGTTYSGEARVGNDCLIMAYSHVAHDCVVGNNVIISNVSQLAGHVMIGDWAILGGMVKVVQFCRIGKHSMIGAGVKITKDIPDYALVGRDPARIESINKIGLRRRGFSNETIDGIENFFDTVFLGKYNTTEGIEEFLRINEPIDEVRQLIEFIRSSKKGVVR
ncbi:MAG: acyl-ACP--UDP-N-acetylglucosamine O-acyltransferase [Ignavibacteriae bacterium]|nr:acyl-ACP--UDP-N-acetylglucosamine O-acyltransferase [Ignavibacteriota bacterium]